MTTKRAEYISNDDGTKVLVAFYEGHFGPTLRVDIQKRETLQAVRDRVDMLMTGRMQTCELADSDLFVLAPPIRSVVLAVVPKVRFRKRMTMQKDRESNLSLNWIQKEEDWEDIRDFIDNLLSTDRPTHLEFLDSDLNDAIVELAYRQ